MEGPFHVALLGCGDDLAENARRRRSPNPPQAPGPRLASEACRCLDGGPVSAYGMNPYTKPEVNHV